MHPSCKNPAIVPVSGMFLDPKNLEVSFELSVVSWIVMEASLICNVLLVTDKIVRLKTSSSEYAQVFIDP